MIKNLVFDMGGVLYHFVPRQFIELAGITDEADIQLILKHLYGSKEWALADAGELDEPDVEAHALPLLPERLRPYVHWLTCYPILPMAGMVDFLAECKAAGYRIYLLSNASHRHDEYWPLVPGHEFFDGLVVSAKIHMVKPNRDIFEYLCSHFDLNPSETLFVDDLAVNCDGARSAGLYAFNFKEDIPALKEYLKGLGE